MAVLKVAGLEMAGADDGQAHADGAVEDVGGHRASLLVLGQRHLRVLQVAEDLGGVGGQARTRHEVEQLSKKARGAS
ncbi:hypothetical protein ACFCZ5_27850 [Streptomyces microflavus]|uniref:hypothetical protein n=1 Tax=Streptomyces microflavus TaxID=1919 RepID=UPI0035DAFFF3